MRECYSTPRGEAAAWVRDYGDGDGELHLVGTKKSERGKGHMRTVMAELLADADREGVCLLVVSGIGRSDGSGMTAEELVEWYERLGFESLGPWCYVESAGTHTTRMQRPPRVTSSVKETEVAH